MDKKTEQTHCQLCGRVLKSDKSRLYGMGPSCLRRFHYEQKVKMLSLFKDEEKREVTGDTKHPLG